MSRAWLAILAPGAALVGLAVGLAAGYVALLGPMFGIWGRRDLTLGLLATAVLICLALASTLGDQNPTRRVAPDALIGPPDANPPPLGSDPQTYYFGTRTPVSARARQTGDNRWFWWAIPSGVTALGLILIDAL